MLLKRNFDMSGPEPRLVGVKLLHGGPRQRFSPGLIERGIVEGWIQLGDNMVKLRTDPPATYKIVRMPGYYCCHCNESLSDSPSGPIHVSMAHPGKKSPDPFNPSGFRKDNFYECIRVERVEGRIKEVR